METIVLASGSPRRRELLEQVGIPFIVDVEEVDEDLDIANPIELTKELSERKARAVLSRHPNEWVLGADTVVFYDGEILGKPKDEQEAFDMLCMLAGRTHEVVTGVTLLRIEAEQNISDDIDRSGVPNDVNLIKAVGRKMPREVDLQTYPIQKIQFSERTKVRMYAHEREVLRAYVATGEPLDKAGAYGIQGRGAILVERIEGDYNNVVGLPVARVYRELWEAGIVES